MRREWKSSVKSKRAVTNLRLYQHDLPALLVTLLLSVHPHRRLRQAMKVCSAVTATIPDDWHGREGKWSKLYLPQVVWIER